jgi:hypothetical protein
VTSYRLSGCSQSIWEFKTTQFRKPIVSLQTKTGLNSGVITVMIVRERNRPRAAPDAMNRFARPLRELVAKAFGEGLSRNALAQEMMESAQRLERGAIW